MDLFLFDEVAEAFRALVPPELGVARLRARRYGIKVWFDEPEPPREHYEAQVIGAGHVPEAAVLALEIGFHAEHPKADLNDRAMAPLRRREKTWRRSLGADPVVGGFLGRADDWRRLSETWADPDLGDPDLGLELAGRLVDYVSVLEPLRTRS